MSSTRHSSLGSAPLQDTLHRSAVTRYRVACARTLEGRILDCGGGLGAYLPYLHGDVIVLDRDIRVLGRLTKVPRVSANIERLPFRDRCFDHVWACAVVQYADLELFVREAVRITRPGGHVLILVPNGASPWDWIKKYLGMKTWWSQKGIRTQYTVRDLARYGVVTGEIRFLPMERLLRRLPRIGHTLMLDITVQGGPQT